MKKSIYKNLKTLCLIVFIAYISSLVLVQKLGNSLNKTISNYATVEAERFVISHEFVSTVLRRVLFFFFVSNVYTQYPSAPATDLQASVTFEAPDFDVTTGIPGAVTEET